MTVFVKLLLLAASVVVGGAFGAFAIFLGVVP